MTIVYVVINKDALGGSEPLAVCRTRKVSEEFRLAYADFNETSIDRIEVIKMCLLE